MVSLYTEGRMTMHVLCVFVCLSVMYITCVDQAEVPDSDVLSTSAEEQVNAVAKIETLKRDFIST